MRQMIDQHEAAARASGARIMFSSDDSVPFELGTFLVQDEARRVFGAPCLGSKAAYAAARFRFQAARLRVRARRSKPSREIFLGRQRSRGEHAISRNTIAHGTPDDPAEPLVTAACFFCCRRAMGEAFTRHSLRLFQFEGDIRKTRTRCRAAGTRALIPHGCLKC
jgi:hypothetical protein